MVVWFRGSSPGTETRKIDDAARSEQLLSCRAEIARDCTPCAYVIHGDADVLGLETA